MKRSVILTDRLGPDILLVLTMKRQDLHRERAHLKVPGCSLVLSALLTKKFPTFLSRFNEKSGMHPSQSLAILICLNHSKNTWLSAAFPYIYCRYDGKPQESGTKIHLSNGHS